MLSVMDEAVRLVECIDIVILLFGMCKCTTCPTFNSHFCHNCMGVYEDELVQFHSTVIIWIAQWCDHATYNTCIFHGVHWEKPCTRYKTRFAEFICFCFILSQVSQRESCASSRLVALVKSSLLASLCFIIFTNIQSHTNHTSPFITNDPRLRWKARPFRGACWICAWNIHIMQ